jgi:hypothetical protein
MSRRRLINSVTFGAEEVVVEYGEVYEFGVVKFTRIEVPMTTREYLDEVTDVETSIQKLLDDVLEDTSSALAISADDLQEGEDDEDVDLQMGG